MIVRDAVSTVRSMVTGALLDEISVLSAPYDPATDSTVSLKYPKRAIAQGSVLCVGLNTFMAMNVSADGGTIEVLPSMDGGPNVASPVGEMVRVRPTFTTWAIFRELQSEIDSMSTPDVGLYWPKEYQFSSLDRVNGTYVLPLPDPETMWPFRLLRSEYRIAGTDAWQTFTEAQFHPETGTIRVFFDPPGAIEYRFSLATTFGQMVTLDDDLTDIGVSNYSADIPMLGAAASMALGWEGRRTQPFSQGDSRRATEVQVGSNASLSRQFVARQKESINSELTRLLNLYGYRQPNTSGSTGQRYGGGWR
ncbi:MAG: hypothetical protein ACOYB3_01740 [Azonexus sp.]